MTFDGELAYVVNRATETSVPVDIAEALGRYGDCEADVVCYDGDGTATGRTVHDRSVDGRPTDDHSVDGRSIDSQSIDSQSVDVRSVDVRSVGSSGRFDPAGYASLRATLAEYDVVQVHHHFSGILGRVLASVDGPAVVSRIGNVWRGFSRIARTLEGVTRPLCDRVVCNSRAVFDSLPAWERRLTGRDAYRVIPNGFDERAVAANLASEPDLPFDGLLEGDGVVVSSAAVLTAQKDLETLVRGVAALDDDRQDQLTVLLAGDGPRRDALESLVAALDLESTVEFLGLLRRREVHHLLAGSDVFAMPSRWEGFSAASLEAMGVGTACLFSDIAPFREPYDGYALFHEPSDHRDLAATLARYLADPELRTSAAAAGRAHVLENYHVAATVESYLDLYEELEGA